MRSKQIVGLFYILSGLIGASHGFIMGVYSNFLRAAGLDELMANMVNVSFFITITICEIPTGIFADIFGRKSSFLISCFLETISFVMYGFSRNLTGFISAEMVGAIGKTFMSGAFDAWLKDSLNHSKEEVDLKKVMSTSELITKLSVIFTAVLGGWIGDSGLNLPFFAGAATFAICGITAFVLMKEPYFIVSKFSIIGSLEHMKQTWKKSLAFTKADLNFRFVLIVSALQMFVVMGPNMEWQKVFSDHGLSNSLNGIIGGLINVSLMVGAVLSAKLSLIHKEEKMQIILSQIITGLGIVLTVTFTNISLVMVFFLMHEVARGVTTPLMRAYTQNCITNDDERATIGSLGSMVQHFGGALGLIVSGIIAKYAGITPAWIVSGTVLILGSLLLAKNHNKKVS